MVPSSECACLLNTVRMSSVRSSTSASTASSTDATCAGVRSSSHTATVAAFSPIAALSSSILPLPR